MTLTFSIDPNNDSDIAAVRALLDVLTSRRLPDSTREGVTGTVADQIADDLFGRLGERGRELLLIAARFDTPFSLPDLAKETGDTVPQMKSRWANLGRSVAQTRNRFRNVEIFQERIPSANGPGYFTFIMSTDIRRAIRRLGNAKGRKGAA